MPKSQTHRTAPHPSDIWRETITGIDFIRIPGAGFRMGSGEWDRTPLLDELPVHWVLLDEFWMARFPVTVEQYMTGVSEGGLQPPIWLEPGNPCHMDTGENPLFKSLGETVSGSSYPVTGISWFDAAAYAGWLSERTGRTFSMPSEAQWEFAARSGGREEPYAGSDTPDPVAWYESNSGMHAHPVGEKKPNGIGLYDMCGNVCEWCFDLYSRFAYAHHRTHNPVNTRTGDCRVVRGGSWNYGARDVRCTDRGLYVPEYRGHDLGFRLVMTTWANVPS